jgi:hypothetical protein
VCHVYGRLSKGLLKKIFLLTEEDMKEHKLFMRMMYMINCPGFNMSLTQYKQKQEKHTMGHQ